MRTDVRFTQAATVLLAALAFAACSTKDGKGSAADSGRAQSQALGDSAKMIAQNLMKFDTLDFDVFSNQKWDRLKESHAQDIIVSWPDGHDTHGLAKHIDPRPRQTHRGLEGDVRRDTRSQNHRTPHQNRERTLDCGDRSAGWNLLEAHADWQRKVCPADRQKTRFDHGNDRALDGCRCNGSRMAVLGQPDLYEATRPRSLNYWC